MRNDEHSLTEWNADTFGDWAECRYGTTPEKKLLCAIVERAICDYLARPEDCTSKPYKQEVSHLRREAEAYLFSTDLAPWSFRWVCQQLAEDAPLLVSKIRSGIMDLREKGQRFFGFHPVHYLNPKKKKRRVRA